MSDFVKNRSAIVTAILHIIKPDHAAKDIEDANRLWWINLRSTGGLGLTDLGYDCFQRAELESYTFHIQKTTPSLAVYGVEIDRKLQCPYYLRYIKKDRYVTVYDTRIASIIQLHGDFASYINSINNSYD
jgi:hypothetical protein